MVLAGNTNLSVAISFEPVIAANVEWLIRQMKQCFLVFFEQISYDFTFFVMNFGSLDQVGIQKLSVKCMDICVPWYRYEQVLAVVFYLAFYMALSYPA